MDDEPEEKADDSGKGPLGDHWILSTVPWREIKDPSDSVDPALVDARWHGVPVVVIRPQHIEKWAEQSQAAILSARDTKSNFDATAERIDLRATFETEELIGVLPRNALVIKDCEGVQIGNWNSQVNIHKFRVEEVHIRLDQALARHLARSLEDTAVTEGAPSGRPPRAYTKVAIWNSRGVQIGDHNKQRNVFKHVATRPEVPLGDHCSNRQWDRVVDKLREGRINAAETDLIKMVQEEFRADSESLFSTLPRTFNKTAEHVPRFFHNEGGASYGTHPRQKIQVDSSVRSFDAPTRTWLLEYSQIMSSSAAGEPKRPSSALPDPRRPPSSAPRDPGLPPSSVRTPKLPGRGISGPSL